MVKKLLVATGLGAVVLGLWFYWAIITDSPPQFFPLNNPRGQYKISKKCPGGQGWNENLELTGDGYCVEYKGQEVFLSQNKERPTFFRVTVGYSRVELEPLVGKNVKNIEGRFISSGQQCIKGKCIDIGGPYVVLNIESLELAD